MGYRMSASDWEIVLEADKADDTIARMIAEEFTWSWASCWFADTGEFNHDHMEPLDGSYAKRMDNALFGWWWESDSDDKPRNVKARKLMLDYLNERESKGEMGRVPGFAKLWPTDR